MTHLHHNDLKGQTTDPKSPITYLDGFSQNLSWLWISSHTTEAKCVNLQTIDLYEAWGDRGDSN